MAIEKKHMATRVVLGDAEELVRFSHEHVFQKHMNKESGKFEYSVTFLIPKTATKTIARIKAAVKEQAAILFDLNQLPPMFWKPLRDGDTDVNSKGKPYGDECKGHYVLAAKLEVKTKADGTPEYDEKPEVKGTTRGKDGKLVDLTGGLKSGDWGRGSVNLKSFTKGVGGVGCYLNSVQLVREGDPLSSRGSADDDYGDYSDGGDYGSEPDGRPSGPSTGGMLD